MGPLDLDDGDFGEEELVVEVDRDDDDDDDDDEYTPPPPPEPRYLFGGGGCLKVARLVIKCTASAFIASLAYSRAVKLRFLVLKVWSAPRLYMSSSSAVNSLKQP